jgi:hypothetical protein
MSTAAHGHDAHAPAHAHDDHAHAHDDHAFDGEPAQDIPADEPRTPGWIPALGAALFLAAGIAFIATLDGPAKGAAGPTGAAVAAPPPAPVRVITPPPGGAAAPGAAAPGADPAQPARRLNPEQMKDLQRRIQEAQQQRGNAPTAPPGGHPPHPGHDQH